MSKDVVFLVASDPSSGNGMGYHDYVEVRDNGNTIYGSHASVCPNGYKINKQGLPIPWNLLYGWIADGMYVYKCIEHKKYGKCLIVNDGGEVDSRVPNPRHGGRPVLAEIFVHQGGLNCQNPEWRGSMGCPTLHRDLWPGFIEKFNVGEKGKLYVQPLIKGKIV